MVKMTSSTHENLYFFHNPDLFTSISHLLSFMFSPVFLFFPMFNSFLPFILSVFIDLFLHYFCFLNDATSFFFIAKIEFIHVKVGFTLINIYFSHQLRFYSCTRSPTSTGILFKEEFNVSLHVNLIQYGPIFSP